MTIFGILRLRNEARWSAETVRRILPLCERVFVFDDGSTDGTPEFCEQVDERVTVIRSPFREPVDMGLDETRDKDYLLNRVMGCVSDIHLRGNPNSPYWCLAIDGDEWLDPAGIPAIREKLVRARSHAYKLPIPFLWDSDLSLVGNQGQRRVRVDQEAYHRFLTQGRPSLFRLYNKAFRFQGTPWGGNFHCASIPQELLGGAYETIPQARLWHLGYNDKADRLRKYAWYNQIDPNNAHEDMYRHMIQGDAPEVPPGAKLKHAGPIQFAMM